MQYYYLLEVDRVIRLRDLIRLMYKSVQMYITKHSRTALANSKAHARTVCTDVEDTKSKQANQAHVRKTEKKSGYNTALFPGGPPPQY